MPRRPRIAPTIGRRFDYRGSASDVAMLQVAHGLVVAVDAWRWTPGDITEFAGMLADDDRFEVVLANRFFALLDAAAVDVRTARLGAQAQRSVPIRPRFARAKDR